MTSISATVRISALLLAAWCPGALAAELATNHGTWTDVAPPSARSGHVAVYDPVRDRMIVLEGYDSGYRREAWQLPLSGAPIWSALVASGNAPLRTGHTAIYDPVRDRVLLFGGNDGNFRNDVRALSLAGAPAWSAVFPAGTPPSARQWHSAIYDPVRDRMVVFGGTDGNRRNDVWVVSLGGSPAWTALTPAGTPPTPRIGHSAIYDPVRDRMLVFGGVDDSGNRNDVWALSFSDGPAWEELMPSGTPPTGRAFHEAIYDPETDRMLVFAGSDGQARNDLAALSLAGSPTWSALTPAGGPPPVRTDPSAIYDPVRRRMVVFAGDGGGGLLNDVWTVALAGPPAWNPLIPGSSRPPARLEHSAIYDPVRDRMVIFAGSGSFDLNDTWALSFSGNSGWSAITPTGGPPAVRFDHSTIYDPVRDRMLVFGGVNAAFAFNDVWALSLSGTPTWSLLAPLGTPPVARFSHSAIYDPVRDRMLVFGGHDHFSTYFNDVWALSLAGTPTWTQIVPTGTPPVGRDGQSAIYDPVRDRMIVFGGSNGLIRNDSWALSLSGSPAWTQLAPIENPLNHRTLHTAVYDPWRDRMVVFGGTNGVYLNNVWALSLTGTETWLEQGPAGILPPTLVSAAGVYDPVRDRMVVFGGYDGTGLRNDAWALGWGATVSVPEPGGQPPRRGLQLAPPRPNPAREGTIVEFDLAAPARVTVDIFDAQGRWVRRIAEGRFTAGPHTAEWRGDDDQGRMLGSGVFILRLQAGDQVATRRAVRIR
jgi:hypothetical protein